MDKLKLKDTLIALEKHHIDEAEMKYDDFLLGNLLDKTDVIDDDDQSHHRQSIEISDQLEEQAHVHLEHFKTIQNISFTAKTVVEPGAVVSVNGRCMVIAVSKPVFTIDGRKFIGISTNAPIYKELAGKKAGESFVFNGNNFKIETVY
ncbi:hypothetical protein SAMN04489761_4466 [Tenacibaculum sp. MAR_2009_124]|uniref:hypothetical protein n=1 Tax=Tenacibaculum sp. MAR_2009_124 TaxID=1250059 RepID=UPI00089964E1|nr:hypothetical protein [Tenacibaculum sp. MAR_2009_124]SED16000.1 hypothetical protein SAMN04489761_4466 [Tenacibaculum sp. MAR_2009_124]